MEAAAYCETTYWDAAWRCLNQTRDVRTAKSNFFGDAARILCLPDAPCDCLVTLGATKVSSESEDVHAALKALRVAARMTFQTRLEQTVEDGQLAVETTVRSLTMTFNTAVEGKSLKASDGALQAELEAIGPFVVRVLKSNA